MDQHTKERIIKLICLAVVVVLAWHVLIYLWPHIQLFLAMCGAWYLINEYKRVNRH